MYLFYDLYIVFSISDVYVTVNMCNQGIRVFTEIFREYAYSLITHIYCNIYILRIIVLINGTRICVFTVLGEWGLLLPAVPV